MIPAEIFGDALSVLACFGLVLGLVLRIAAAVHTARRNYSGPYRGTYVLSNKPKAHRCRTPRTSRRHRQDLWRCEGCNTVYRQRAICGPGDSFWIWDAVGKGIRR